MKVILTHKSKDGLQEEELAIIELSCIPPIGAKYWFNEEYYIVRDLHWYSKENKQFRLDFYETYVEIILQS